jgi:hypothetical protein
MKTLLSLLVFVALILSGCSKTHPTLEGTWISDDNMPAITFSPDGSFLVGNKSLTGDTGLPGKWRVNNRVLEIYDAHGTIVRMGIGFYPDGRLLINALGYASKYHKASKGMTLAAR